MPRSGRLLLTERADEDDIPVGARDDPTVRVEDAADRRLLAADRAGFAVARRHLLGPQLSDPGPRSIEVGRFRVNACSWLPWHWHRHTTLAPLPSSVKSRAVQRDPTRRVRRPLIFAGTAHMLSASEVAMARRLVGWLLTLLLVGCGGPTPTPASGPPASSHAPSPATVAPISPAASSPATPVPPSSPPSLPPSPSVLATSSPTPIPPLPGTAALTLPSGTVVTVPLASERSGSAYWQFPPKAGGPPVGPYVYLGAEPWLHGLRHLSVVDLRGGSVRYVPLMLQPYESLATALVSGLSLVVLAWVQQGPRPEQMGTPCTSLSGRPIAWRLLAATLGSDGLPAGAWRTLDAGVSSRQFTYPNAGVTCDDPVIPPVAVSGSTVAYAVDHPTSQYPAGSRIVLRSLSSGSMLRVIDTATQVTALALSATSVAWVESPNAQAPGPVTRWRVMRAPVATGLAREVPLAVPGHSWRYAPESVVLDGSAVLTSPGEWQLGWGTVVRSAGNSVVALNRNPTPFCLPFGAASGVALLTCSEEGYDERVATWSAQDGLRILDGPLPAVMHSAAVTGDWVTWTFYSDPELTRPVLLGVPLAALLAANR